MRSPRPRVGVIGQAARGWSAGVVYTRTLLRALVARGGHDRFDLVLLTSPEGESIARGLSVRTHLLGGGPALPEAWLDHLAPGAPRAARLVARAAASALRLSPEPPFLFAADRLGLDAILPAQQLPRRTRAAAAGWIPDFQHVHEPSFFGEAERAERDRVFSALAENATRVIVSSAWAREHFEAFAPRHAHKAFTLPFPSTFAFERPEGQGVGEAARELGLPEKYALVVNQLWAHKNHETVVAAVAEARARGVDVPVVMVGMPADYRDPENGVVSRLLQRALRERVHDRVFVLGKVAFPALVDLMRGAAVVIQPSRFEGWSTTVEDARALGRPLICSDLPVHHEQAPDAVGFFGCDDAGGLARLLVERWRDLARGPDFGAEGAALDREMAFAERYGDRLVELIGGLVERRSGLES